MRIFRGNVGVELSLDELSNLLMDDEQMDDLLNLIYELEMDEVMNYNDDDIAKFERQLMDDVADLQEAQKSNGDRDKMKRILEHLEKYGR